MIKGQKRTTFRGDGETTCRCCEAKLGRKTPYFEACSPTCAKELAELRAIPLPAAFVISLVNRTRNLSEREIQLKKYIERHNLDEKKVISRFNEIASKIKKEGALSIKRKELVA